MPNSLFGIFLSVLLVAVGVLVLFGFGAYLYEKTELATGTYGASLVRYSNLDLGLSVRYPSDFTVNESYRYDGLGSNKQITGISFTVPKSKIPGTNLSSDTYISVEVIPNQLSCSASLFVPEPAHTEAIIDRGVSYTYSERDGAAAGNRYEEHVYALTKASPCVAVRYFIHSTNIGNYPEGTVREFDRKNLLEVFDTVRRTLSVKQ